MSLLQQQQQQQRSSDMEDKWESCSLCSSGEEREEEDNESRLPLPGRESHTCDMDQYAAFLAKLKSAERSPEVDTPFHEKFWDFFGKVLAKAEPTTGFIDSNTVVPKGPRDNAAFLKKVSETDLINPIHPIQISQASGIPLRQVMTELLYATKVGMVSMKMTPNCLRCGSSACAIHDLNKVIHSDGVTLYCEGCRYQNYIECLQKIKVVFVLNMDVLYVLAESFACQPSKASMAANQVFCLVPATFSGSGFRYSLGCGGDLMLRPALPAGRYRMHCPVSRTDNYLEVERDSREEDEPFVLPVHVSDIVCRSPKDKRKTLRSPHGKMHLDVFTDTHSFFVCWIQDDKDDHTLLYLPKEERKPYTNAQELLSHPTYQYLFNEGAAVNLTKVVKRMQMTNPKQQKPKKRRLIRSSQA